MSMPLEAEVVGWRDEGEEVRVRRWHGEQMREALRVIRDRPFILCRWLKRSRPTADGSGDTCGDARPDWEILGCQEILEIARGGDGAIVHHLHVHNLSTLHSVLLFVVYTFLWFALQCCKYCSN